MAFSTNFRTNFYVMLMSSVWNYHFPLLAKLTPLYDAEDPRTAAQTVHLTGETTNSSPPNVVILLLCSFTLCGSVTLYMSGVFTDSRLPYVRTWTSRLRICVLSLTAALVCVQSIVYFKLAFTALSSDCGAQGIYEDVSWTIKSSSNLISSLHRLLQSFFISTQDQLITKQALLLSFVAVTRSYIFAHTPFIC